MTDDAAKKAKDRAVKAIAGVERQAALARGRVISAQRAATAERQRKKVMDLSREVKRLKSEDHMSNYQIAEKFGISESTVRTLLAMDI